MIGTSEKIKLQQPSHGFYHDYTNFVRLNKGKILFKRDASEEKHGGVYLADTTRERKKSLWGTVLKSEVEWLKENDRAIVRRTAICMPATPDRELLFIDAKDVMVRMREEYRTRITDTLGRAAGNGHRVMDKLFEQPIVTVATVRDWLNVTQAAANTLVHRLVEIGLLREITGYARNRRFRFDPYLRLFEEPEEVRT